MRDGERLTLEQRQQLRSGFTDLHGRPVDPMKFRKSLEPPKPIDMQHYRKGYRWEPPVRTASGVRFGYYVKDKK